MKLIAAILGGLGLVLACTPALAQTEQRTGSAPSNFRQGIDAEKAGNYALARQKFDLACNIDRSGAGCLNLAILQSHPDYGAVNEVLARKAFKSGCELESAESCLELGRYQKAGRGGPKDLKGAQVTLTESCYLFKTASGCQMLGDLRRFDLKDPALARDAYRDGCDAGLTGSCLSYAALLSSTVGGPADYPKAIAIFERQCTAGDSFYCAVAGQNYVESGMPQADKKAEPLLRRACDMNASAGCFRLGELMVRKGGKANRLPRGPFLRGPAT